MYFFLFFLERKERMTAFFLPSSLRETSVTADTLWRSQAISLDVYDYIYV